MVLVLKIIVLFLAIAAALLLDAVFIVHTSEAVIIERLGSKCAIHKNIVGGDGKFWGVRLKIPYIDKIVKRLSLKDQTKDYPPKKMTTMDNVELYVDVIAHFNIVDVEQYYYGVENPLNELEQGIYGMLKNVIGAMTFDQTLAGRERINGEILTVMKDRNEGERLGLNLIKIEIQGTEPVDPEFKKAMEKQAAAERERRATVTLASGEAEAITTKAEAQKNAEILKSQGAYEATKIQYQAVAEGMRLMQQVGGTTSDALTLRKLETLSKVSDGRATKIVIPSDVAGLAGITTAASAIIKEETKENKD